MKPLTDADVDRIEMDTYHGAGNWNEFSELIDHLRACREALRHVQSIAGAPDAAEACRQIIKRARAALGVE